jgi:hypothetical protein
MARSWTKEMARCERCVTDKHVASDVDATMTQKQRTLLIDRFSRVGKRHRSLITFYNLYNHQRCRERDEKKGKVMRKAALLPLVAGGPYVEAT